MDQWFGPFHSQDWANHIRQGVEQPDARLVGGVTCRMLAPRWSSQTTDEMGPAEALCNMPK
ncbi:MAG TPA: hypothetical protein VGA52_14410 [Anaerolineales bacterium]|jgi:hypothetical protein